MIDPDVIHLESKLDGYPVCWPMHVDEPHTSTRDDARVTCPDCSEFLETA